jgi:hypothetical protein
MALLEKSIRLHHPHMVISASVQNVDGIPSLTLSVDCGECGVRFVRWVGSGNLEGWQELQHGHICYVIDTQYSSGTGRT